MLNSCWHFNIYEQDKFRAQLSWVRIEFYNLGAWWYLPAAKIQTRLSKLGPYQSLRGTNSQRIEYD